MSLEFEVLKEQVLVVDVISHSTLLSFQWVYHMNVNLLYFEQLTTMNRTLKDHHSMSKTLLTNNKPIELS